MTTKHEVRISAGQMSELVQWALRLSSDDYQKRRSYFRKLTDPRAVLEGVLLHPFLTPLYKGLRLKTEGPECAEPIDIGNLDFFTGDVLRRDAAGTWETWACRFSQHHAEHLLERRDELPRFYDGTEVIFPGTVYISVEGTEIEFYPCLVWHTGMPKMGLTPRCVAFQPHCRFPYQLHSR